MANKYDTIRNKLHVAYTGVVTMQLMVGNWSSGW